MVKNEIIQIGKRIRERRNFLGLTREQLAERTELSVQFLAEIETGKKSMTTNSLSKVSKALNLSTDFIVFGETPMETDNPVLRELHALGPQQREYALELLRVFVAAMGNNG